MSDVRLAPPEDGRSVKVEFGGVAPNSPDARRLLGQLQGEITHHLYAARVQQAMGGAPTYGSQKRIAGGTGVLRYNYNNGQETVHIELAPGEKERLLGPSPEDLDFPITDNGLQFVAVDVIFDPKVYLSADWRLWAYGISGEEDLEAPQTSVYFHTFINVPTDPTYFMSFYAVSPIPPDQLAAQCASNGVSLDSAQHSMAAGSPYYDFSFAYFSYPPIGAGFFLQEDVQYWTWNVYNGVVLRVKKLNRGATDRVGSIQVDPIVPTIQLTPGDKDSQFVSRDEPYAVDGTSAGTAGAGFLVAIPIGSAIVLEVLVASQNSQLAPEMVIHETLNYPDPSTITYAPDPSTNQDIRYRINVRDFINIRPSSVSVFTTFGAHEKVTTYNPWYPEEHGGEYYHSSSVFETDLPFGATAGFTFAATNKWVDDGGDVGDVGTKKQPRKGCGTILAQQTLTTATVAAADKSNILPIGLAPSGWTDTAILPDGMTKIAEIHLSAGRGSNQVGVAKIVTTG